MAVGKKNPRCGPVEKRRVYGGPRLVYAARPAQPCIDKVSLALRFTSSIL